MCIDIHFGWAISRTDINVFWSTSHHNFKHNQPLLRQVIIDKGKVIKRYTKKKDEEKQVFPDYHIIFLSWLMDLKFKNPICMTKYQSTIHYKKKYFILQKAYCNCSFEGYQGYFILSSQSWMNECHILQC